MEYLRLATLIRAYAVRMTHRGKSGHVGSSLSMADLISVLYTKILRVNPSQPDWQERDRFILSKGHAAAGVYVALAEKGFFPKDWLDTYYQDNGRLSGHISHHVPGVEFSTGSLGHGLPVAAGMAINAKRKNKNYRIFALLSDGDCNEGSTWESIMFAAQHHLDNLIAILDYNKIQALGRSKDIIDLEPLTEKLKAFHWAVKEINGHNYQQIEDALTNVPLESSKPSFIIAHTIKGKGVSFFEDTVSCHYKYANEEELEKAYNELGVKI
ncbi:transketolase [Candidatus Desantisbacteria bacterium CG1_02_38_46]|uniref:Transketolase n=2 Tax=unclassified Candidatus Desantisiibacteriota TaxID=3106372 RepID=A0A1J4SEN6_9BACT|nr:MAG: transketolase [Candidatus Desantisbacteria bacterium CG1_02_38_46]PIU52003.1 MAG: transketolase [Candidatus Desantisbacteria bacterium CG07_land_8_20_14_0_80_39_15]